MKKIIKSCAGIAVALFFSSTFPQYSIPPMAHRLLLADEGNGKVHYINLGNPTEKWTTTCSNRDLQLIGNDRLMVSDNSGTGYSELNLLTGAIIRHVSITGVAGGINSAFRLSNKEVFCARDGSPAKILKIDSTGKTLGSITLSLDASVRICRPTPKGSYIIGGKVAGMMCEFDSTGKKIWECNAGGEPYMALRLPNGTTLISTGYGGQMVLADKQGAVIKKFPTAENRQADVSFWKAANPNFFAGFQILHNGNIVVANWQGHGTEYGASGFQLIEIDSALTKAVSYWKQNAAMVASLHGVIVLDSLDTKLLHSDFNGILQPLSDPLPVARPASVGFKRAWSYCAASVNVVDLQGRLYRAQPKHCCFIALHAESAQLRRHIAIDDVLYGN
jgi:hypothetical protein